MLKKCPPHAPSGKHNPSGPLPPAYLAAHGITEGKAGNTPGKTMKIQGKTTLVTGLSHWASSQQTCHQRSGDRKVANGQRGRPPFKSGIIQPAGHGVFKVEFDFNPNFPASTNLLTLSFREGKQYLFPGILSGDASQFFPGVDYTVLQTFTDPLLIQHALEYYNRVAKKSFLAAGPASTSPGTAASKLVWNPTLSTTCTLTATLIANFSWQFQVVAANGAVPTGTIFSPFPGMGTTVLTAPDNGVVSNSIVPHYFTFTEPASFFFAGSAGFGSAGAGLNYTGMTNQFNQVGGGLWQCWVNYPTSWPQIPIAQVQVRGTTAALSSGPHYISPIAGYYTIESYFVDPGVAWTFDLVCPGFYWSQALPS